MKLFGIALIMSSLFINGVQAQNYWVTTTNERGKGSLRSIIKKANKSGEACTIGFKIPKKDRGYCPRTRSWTIHLDKELPSILAQVHIDGYSQDCARPNSESMDQANNAHISVELRGKDRCADHVGLLFGRGSNGSSVAGLSIQDYETAVRITSDNIHLFGCFIGVNTNGSKQGGVKTAIDIESSAHGTLIGGGEPYHRTAVAGNGYRGAILNKGSNTRLEGLTVNLTKSGDSLVCLNDGRGIVSSATRGLSIGGPELNQRVVCAGYQHNVYCDTTAGDRFYNVFAGVDLTGTCCLGGGNGLTIVYDALGSLDLPYGGHEIKHCLFSGHCKSGIVLGDKRALHRIVGVSIEKTKLGTDYTGEHSLPNGEDGLRIMHAEGTYINDITCSFNGQNGMYQSRSSFGTIVDSMYTSANGIGGVRIEGPERPENEFEGQMMNTRVIGNGNNAIATSCGVIRSLNSLISEERKEK